MYCVYTNRTPSTAMRGFGITAVDFAIECHMDKVVEKVGMNPIDLRILNAYRDGDIKAHRRVAKNTALIECCQVVAQKAAWPISVESAAAKSTLGGGEGWRAEIPETLTDQAGHIGERRRIEIPPEPFGGATTRGKVAAGTHGEAVVAAEVQDAEMALTRPTLATALRRQRLPPTSPQLSTFATSQSPVPPQPEQPAPFKPDKPFQRGVKRPGVSRFISGTRRR